MSNHQVSVEEKDLDENQIIALRREKLHAIRRGEYISSDKFNKINEIKELDIDENGGFPEVAVLAKLVGGPMGNDPKGEDTPINVFYGIEDESGAQIQIHITKYCSEKALKLIKQLRETGSSEYVLWEGYVNEYRSGNTIVLSVATRYSELKDLARIAFPNNFERDSFAKDISDKYDTLDYEEKNKLEIQEKTGDKNAKYGYKDKEVLESEGIKVKVAGRLILKRIMGKSSFATIQDGTGNIQIYISSNVGKITYQYFKTWDLGDIVGAEGTLFRTKTGELTIRVSQIRLLSKSLRPLPDKHKGLSDQETKYRQRYVDLIANADSRDVFIKRSKIIQAVRNFMVSEQYLEVETPMMHPIPGGATAKPFVTHHNALDIPLYLRIAPELYLKRLVVGGLERVFEINRSFRNEGMSVRHNPEFTMIEFYEAFCDYNRMMQMAEDTIRAACRSVSGSLKIEYNGKEVDLESPFERLTILEAIKKYNPHYTDEQLNDAEWLKKEIVKHGESLPYAAELGSLQLALFEGCAESKLWNPTFIVDYPVEVSPLARASDSKAGLTERFELFVVGRELANGYSELNDPEDQAARFKAQVAQKDAGDDEAMHYDADYIRAMEYGLPPTGGCGIGIDRLVMLLTDTQTIRDVILFPQMRPE